MKVQRNRSFEPPDIDFIRFYRENFPRIFRFAWGRIGIREEAEQIAQETFRRVYSLLADDNCVLSPSSLTFRIALNLCRDHGRRKRTAMTVDPRLKPDRTESGPEENLIRKQRQSLVRNAFDRLPTRDRNCLLLYREGLSYAEIASATGIKATSIGKVLSRATEKLAANLKEENPHEMPEKS